MKTSNTDTTISDKPTLSPAAQHMDACNACDDLSQPEPEPVPLKSRPDFIAGYREGLADRKRLVENERAERRAALNQPEPVRPTKAELRQLFDDQSGYINDEQVMWWADFHKAACVALARWGRPAMEPASPTNQEIEEWANAAPDVPNEALDPDFGWQRCFTSEEFCRTIRAALEHWDGAE